VKEPTKRRFGWLTRNKDLAKKKEWETYEETKAAEEAKNAAEQQPVAGETLFDVEAIRRELAMSEVEAREAREDVSRRATPSRSVSPMPPAMGSPKGRSTTDLSWDGSQRSSSHLKHKSSSSSLAPIANPYSTLKPSQSYDSGSTPNGSKRNSINVSKTPTSKGQASPGLTPNRAYSFEKRNFSMDFSKTSKKSQQQTHDVHGYGDYDYDEGFGDHHPEDHVQLTFDDTADWRDSSPPPPPAPITSLASSKQQNLTKSTTWGSSSTGTRTPVHHHSQTYDTLAVNKDRPKSSFDTRRDTKSMSYTSSSNGLQYSRGQSLSPTFGGAGANGNGASGGGKGTSQGVKNPWADEEDEFGWGKEQEMTMSFE